MSLLFVEAKKDELAARDQVPDPKANEQPKEE